LAVPANNSSNVKTRVLTAVPLISGFLLALYLAPAWLWAGLMALILTEAGREWAGLAKLGRAASLAYALLLGLSGAALAVYGVTSPLPYYLAVAFWLVSTLLLAKGAPLRNPLILLPLGVLILLPTYLAILTLRQEGPDLLLIVVGLVVIADSAAYFSGRRFGKHKLAPSISPGKTWEGAIGAWIAITIYALVIHLLGTGNCGLPCLPQALAAYWALFVLSVLGDLFESALKRQAGIKDSGVLLPGHGGVLDRIDSLTAVLPAAALFWMWLK